MLRNYLKTALRALRRDAGYSLLNIVGIATGIAACLLIGLFVRSEWSYDRFHDDADRLYRAWVHETYEDRSFTNTITPIPLASALETQIPEVEAAVRLLVRQDVVRRGDVEFRERIHVASADFFETFDFPLLKGDPTTALSAPGRVVLTEETAKTYFGDVNPMGKTLRIRDGDVLVPHTVTGVAKAPPVESSIQFGMVTPFREEAFSKAIRSAWFRVSVETYVRLRSPDDLEDVEAQLPSIIRAAIGEEEYASSQYTVGLQPITSIHLDTSLPRGIEPTSSPMYSLILGAIGLLILVVACINFVTLAVGRSTERAREVGVRKVMGADRGQVMKQFWGEAILTTGSALLLGAVIARIGKPVFESLAGRPLPMDPDLFVVLLIAGLFVAVVATAGGYPALILSRMQPVDIFKGRLPVGSNSGLLRVLVGTQFAVSAVLLVSLFVMHQQIRFVQNAPLGYETAQVVTLPTTGSITDGMNAYERLRSQLDDDSRIVNLAATSFTPDEPWMSAEFEDGRGGYYTVRANLISYDYIETMGIEIAEGRSLDRTISSDTSRGVLVNQALVDLMGWTNPLDGTLPGMPDHEIVGVTSNFHFASLHQPVEPLVLTSNRDLVFRGAVNISIPSSPTPEVVIRLAPGATRGAMEAVEAAWATSAPESPFAYTFLDESVDQQYRQEQRFAQIVAWASGLAVLIACFGLFALVVLITQHRLKEIGIRRTLGASTLSIVQLFSQEFVRVVAAALAVAVPVAYLITRRWLNDFAYHVDLSVLPFAVAAGLVLVLTIATVGVQAFRSARCDPATVLRRE